MSDFVKVTKTYDGPKERCGGQLDETGKEDTLESLISVPLVIRVPQPHEGVKIRLYDMLIEIRPS